VTYLERLHEARHVLFQLTLRDLRVRYKQAVMGFGWALVMPVVIVLSGLLVRLGMAQLTGGSIASIDVLGVAVKAVPWGFFIGGVATATASIVGNVPLVLGVYFPREVLPAATLLAQCVDSLIASTAVAIALLVSGFVPTLTIVWVPLLVAMMVLLTTAAALLLSAANVFFRDVRYIVQVFLTFGIFFAPVFYEPAMLGPTIGRYFMLNPLTPVLEGMRLSVVAGHNLLEPLVSPTGFPVWQPWYLAYSATWAVVTFAASWYGFRRVEPFLAEFI
jgi:ABC-type polysaccharide/polyol phosphate export permease